MKLKCGIKRKIRPEVKRAGTCPEREREKRREGGILSLSPSQCLSMPVLSGHLFKINLRNYHSARVPSLGFYNFIFLLQCLYPKAPQFISAAQPRWIINRGREQKDDERHKRSIIHTQPHTFAGGGGGGSSGGVLLNLLCFYLSTVLLKSDIPCLSLAR